MTATTDIGIRRGQETLARLRRVARPVGRLMAAISSTWSDFVESGQLGPDHQRTISRHTGSRI